MARREFRKLPRFGAFAGSAIAIAASARLLYVGARDGADFSVYWHAVRSWAGGLDPYAVRAADAGFVFKYPPWTLAAFFPLAWLSEPVAKAIWALLSLGATASVVGWVIRRARVAALPAGLVLAAFWWIWLGHFWAGQITLVLLALALWSFDRPSPARLGLLAFGLSTKIFSVLPLAGLRRQAHGRAPWLWLAAFLGLAHVIVLAPYGYRGSHFGARDAVSTLADLYRGWMLAAASGGAALGEQVVRGPANHGFTAALLRVLRVDARAAWADAGVWLVLATGLGMIWERGARRSGLDEPARWAGWLALGVIVHPLAWHHSFVFAYPLAAVAIDRGWRAHLAHAEWFSFGLACVGVALIALVIPQVVGVEVVKPFEYVGSKSWGVVCLAVVCLRCARGASASRSSSAAFSGQASRATEVTGA